MNNPTISVLVPIYNNSKYVNGCIESVVNQTFKDIEIILIDDGSTDPETIKCIDEWAKRDNRIIVDRHENLGCGESLNRALSKSKGIYVSEIDGDDQYYPEALETLYALTENGSVDLVKGSYDADINGKITHVTAWPENLTETLFHPRILNMQEQFAYYMSSPAIWTGLYRRQWLIDNDIHWQSTPGALYQDTSFSFITRASADLVQVTNKKVYLYNLCNSDSSVKQEVTIERFDALRKEYAAAAVYMKKHNLNMWNIFARVMFGGFKWMLSGIKDTDTIQMALAIIRDEMIDEVIYKPYYSADDISFLKSLGIYNG